MLELAESYRQGARKGRQAPREGEREGNKKPGTLAALRPGGSFAPRRSRVPVRNLPASHEHCDLTP